MTNFLTYKEACKNYIDVYKYRKNCKYVIQNGIKLIEDVVWVDWYAKDIYQYLKDGKWTLKQNGDTLIEDVDYVYWYKQDVYGYFKDGKCALIQNGDTLIDNADDVKWYAENVYEYIKDGKRYKKNLDN